MRSVLILDDDSLLRRGVRTIIERSNLPFFVAHEASSVAVALEWLFRNHCDIAIVDMNMPKQSGLDFFRELERINHQVKCIVLSGHDDFEYTSGSLRHGAVDYLLKPVEREVLIDALRRADNRISKDEAVQNAAVSKMDTENDMNFFQDPEYRTLHDQLNSVFHLIHSSDEDARERKLSALVDSLLDDTIADNRKRRYMLFFHHYTLNRVAELFPQFHNENRKETEKLAIYAQGNDYKVYWAHYRAYWNHIFAYADTVREKGAYRDIDRALAYIHEHYHKDINMASVSNYLNIDYSNFSKKFELVTGSNFSGYLKKLRIEGAKNLLATSNEAIAHIADKLSFGNTKHFITTFKKTVGVTPTEYRRLYDGNN